MKSSHNEQSQFQPTFSVSIVEIQQALARLPTNGDALADSAASADSAAAAAGMRHAAVAMVFAGSAGSPDLCLIRRAEREGDPWSGHMAFPGGKEESEDVSLRVAAERETLEEVGLKLHASQYMGGLDHSPVRSGGADTGMRLFPFVYYLGEQLAPLSPNGEVAEAFWIPLSHILDSKNFVEMPLRRNGELFKFPSVSYRGHHIWGVTYRVLVQFARAISRSMPDPV